MQGLTSEEREGLHRRLEDRRRDLERQVDALGPTLDAERAAMRAAGTHDLADESELGSDEESSAALEHHLESELALVRAALTRFAQGEYGVCAGCGQPIPAARLLTYPEAIRCLDCQSQAERGGG